LLRDRLAPCIVACVREEEDRHEHAARLELAVFAGDSVAAYPLPESGQVTLGRAPDNDIPIDDASVSRRHAVLHIGPPLEIEDLGSANGTLVRAADAGSETTDTHSLRRRPGETAEVEVGDSINLGAAMIVIRRATAPEVAPGETPGRGGGAVFVVRDAAMREVYSQAHRAAQGMISVLILGETGVGKEVLAQAIHQNSPRASGPFLPLNCAALSESLLESELFGHEKGAFTGAAQAKPGLFEAADGGTVFLDEVGELPPGIQAKMLRVLEERKVLRVGGRTPRPINVRFISATNRDLEAEVSRGVFRQDVFFRLNGIAFTLPPLRERVAEITPLAQSFLVDAAQKLGRSRAPALSSEAREALLRYAWPGNIRELRNAIDRAVVLCAGDSLLPSHLPPRVRTGSAAPLRPKSAELDATIPPVAREPESVEQIREAMDALERKRIIDALERCAGNQTKAAELLGISRRTLVTKLSAYNLPRPRKGS
jgi:two-component system, NtrC family, response regulator AtoC